MSTSRLQDLERRALEAPGDMSAAIALQLERRRQGLELLPDVPRRDFWEPTRRALRGIDPRTRGVPVWDFATMEATMEAFAAAGRSAALAWESRTLALLLESYRLDLPRPRLTFPPSFLMRVID